MIVISRIDQRFGQLHLLPRRTPIPQAPAIRLFPDDDSTGVGPCSQIGNPLFHTFIMTVQQNRIAIITIIGPGHDHISRSPCRTASSTTEGCGMRNITALPIRAFPISSNHFRQNCVISKDKIELSTTTCASPV